jgi:threonine synthase
VIEKDQRVIVISTAHGLKFSRFKVDYHNQGLESVLEQYPNPPLELPADYEVVRGKIDEVSLKADHLYY